MKTPVRVAITGAAGQISYSIIFRIASGDMLGKDQPVILQLLEIPPAMNALKGVVMELNDCAFPLVAGIIPTDDPNVAFKGTDMLSYFPSFTGCDFRFADSIDKTSFSMIHVAHKCDDRWTINEIIRR